MAITEIKWLNFTEGSAIYINNYYGIPASDFNQLNGKLISTLSFDWPAQGETSTLTLIDKLDRVWTLTVTHSQSNARVFTGNVKIDGTQVASINRTASASQSFYNKNTKAYIVFGYYSPSNQYNMGLLLSYADVSGTSWGQGFFFNGATPASEDPTLLPEPVTVNDFTSYCTTQGIGTWQYLNILDTGYGEASGVGNNTANPYFISIDSASLSAAIFPLLDDSPIVPPTDTDPYADGGYSGDGGGDAGFDLQNDSIDFPSLPTLSAVDTGLVSIYTPSLSQLKALATFLWNANPTDVDWWKKLVANPLDLILGLSIVPVQVPQGTAQTIKVGLIDTGVSVTKAARQFVTVDCGSVTIQKNCGGSALDFSPFTKFSLYLPFIGTRTISTDDIMGRTVHVKYNVDLLSGGCTAMVKITGGPEDNELDAILYQYSGACAISIPLTGETFTNMITSTIQLAASIGATVATGGAAAGVSAASAANSLMSMKPIIERAGGVSGAAGQLGIMKPYLIAEVPRQSVPQNCNQFTGYPSNMKATIGDLTGYTEVDIIYLKGIEATQAELDELETILKGGFII